MVGHKSHRPFACLGCRKCTSGMSWCWTARWSAARARVLVLAQRGESCEHPLHSASQRHAEKTCAVQTTATRGVRVGDRGTVMAIAGRTSLVTWVQFVRSVRGKPRPGFVRYDTGLNEKSKSKYSNSCVGSILYDSYTMTSLRMGKHHQTVCNECENTHKRCRVLS